MFSGRGEVSLRTGRSGCAKTALLVSQEGGFTDVSGPTLVYLRSDLKDRSHLRTGRKQGGASVEDRRPHPRLNLFLRPKPLLEGGPTHRRHPPRFLGRLRRCSPSSEERGGRGKGREGPSPTLGRGPVMTPATPESRLTQSNASEVRRRSRHA